MSVSGGTSDLRFVDLEPGDRRLIDDLLPVLAQLRPHLTAESLAEIYAEGHPQGLRFTAAYDAAGACLGVAGWRIIATTVVARKLYVDDLVTDERRRSRGVGTALLGELTERARTAGCRAIDLDSALHRQDAHRFYIREGLPIVAFHFAKALG
jgi:GNAT superfamily N-acetyltransferase